MVYKILCSLLILCMICCASNTKEQIHAAMHALTIVTPGDEGNCTAYAVGPHAIITADHCITATKTDEVLLLVDNRPAVVNKIIHDFNEHIIVLLEPLQVKDSWKEFDTYLDMDAVEISQLKQGEKVMTFGLASALGCKDCYREGYISGVSKDSDGKVFEFIIMQVAPGDSGSLVFNEKGQIVGAVNAQLQTFVQMYPMLFTKAELNQAKKF